MIERIFTRDEIQIVISNLKRKRRYKSNRQNLVIFRLATCCGLRASEIGTLRIKDVDVASAKPNLSVLGKGGKRRTVPLWWDGGTLADLTAWKAERAAEGDAPFVASRTGTPLDRVNIRRRFIRACGCLPRKTTTHDGRHTFVSLSLAGGRSLAEVRDAAGHRSISTTNTYVHTAGDDGTVGNLFA